MSHIDVSQKISLTKDANYEDIKNSLIARIKKSFNVNTLTEDDTGFSFHGTTGSPAGISKNASVQLKVTIEKNKDTARVLVDGYADIATSLVVVYSAMFILLLLLGLLPGSLETNGANSGPMDVLVFMIFGIFIFYDINKKISEPKEYIKAALESLNTEFG